MNFKSIVISFGVAILVATAPLFAKAEIIQLKPNQSIILDGPDGKESVVIGYRGYGRDGLSSCSFSVIYQGFVKINAFTRNDNSRATYPYPQPYLLNGGEVIVCKNSGSYLEISTSDDAEQALADFYASVPQIPNWATNVNCGSPEDYRSAWNNAIVMVYDPSVHPKAIQLQYKEKVLALLGSVWKISTKGESDSSAYTEALKQTCQALAYMSAGGFSLTDVDITEEEFLRPYFNVVRNVVRGYLEYSAGGNGPHWLFRAQALAGQNGLTLAEISSSAE